MTAAGLALLNIRARPTRNLLLCLIVALSVATALTLLVLADSVSNGLSVGAEERGADLMVLQRDAPDLMVSHVSQQLEAPIARTRGVAGVSGELATLAPVGDSRQSIVLGWSENAHFWKSVPLAAGRLPQPSDPKPVILGSALASSLSLGVGSRLEIFGEPFQVVGISGYVSAMNRSVLIIRLSDLQKLAMRDNQVTLFLLALEPGQTKRDIERIKGDIEKLGRVVVAPTDQMLQGDKNYEFLQAVSKAISVIALAMGSLSVGSALLMAVSERRREIGIMMAIGWSDIRIRTTVIAESLMIGLCGGLLAIPFVLFASLLFRLLPGIGSILAFRLTPGMALLGIVASVLLCGIGSLYPALRATRMNPSQVLRTG